MDRLNFALAEVTAVLFAEARDFADSDHLLRAHECYTAILADEPDNAVALKERGLLRLNMGKYNLALSDLNNALKSLSDEEQANVTAVRDAALLAVSSLSEFTIDEAIAIYNAVSETHSGNERVLDTLKPAIESRVERLIESYNFEEAIAGCKTLLKARSDDRMALDALAKILFHRACVLKMGFYDYHRMWEHGYRYDPKDSGLDQLAQNDCVADTVLMLKVAPEGSCWNNKNCQHILKRALEYRENMLKYFAEKCANSDLMTRGQLYFRRYRYEERVVKYYADEWGLDPSDYWGESYDLKDDIRNAAKCFNEYLKNAQSGKEAENVKEYLREIEEIIWPPFEMALENNSDTNFENNYLTAEEINEIFNCKDKQ